MSTQRRGIIFFHTFTCTDQHRAAASAPLRGTDRGRARRPLPRTHLAWWTASGAGLAARESPEAWWWRLDPLLVCPVPVRPSQVLPVGSAQLESLCLWAQRADRKEPARLAATHGLPELTVRVVLVIRKLVSGERRLRNILHLLWFHRLAHE
eukprot:SAG31_NODE_7717_length_1610_cov_1.463931_1_plen_152_part_00